MSTFSQIKSKYDFSNPFAENSTYRFKVQPPHGEGSKIVTVVAVNIHVATTNLRTRIGYYYKIEHV